MCPVLNLECILLIIFPAAAQVDLGFKETDRAVTEGDNEDFNLQQYGFTGTLTGDVVLRVVPLTVNGFENYRNNNPTRIFADSILNDVAEIADPAECENFCNECYTRPFPGLQDRWAPHILDPQSTSPRGSIYSRMSGPP